jgi:hypothetical protein
VIHLNVIFPFPFRSSKFKFSEMFHHLNFVSVPGFRHPSHLTCIISSSSSSSILVLILLWPLSTAF